MFMHTIRHVSGFCSGKISGAGHNAQFYTHLHDFLESNVKDKNSQVMSDGMLKIIKRCTYITFES
jgi:hypothetical protein